MTATLIPNLPMDQYVIDEVGAPVATLNSGTANLILNRSPLHAWWNHPKLNPQWEQKNSEAFDLGAAMHEAFLEGKSRVVVCHYPDWRTGAARDERDDARERGLIPLLPPQALAVDLACTATEMAIATSPDLQDLGPTLNEQTIVWQDPDTDVWCRSRPDMMTEDKTILLSYKTTSVPAEPQSFARTIVGFGYELQAVFEMQAVTALTGVKPTHYIWVVQETTAPFAVSLIGLHPEMEAFGLDRMDSALARWKHSLERDYWPGYPSRICYTPPPPWAVTQFEERNEL